MEEINLYELLRFYARKWLTILIVVMIGAIAGVGYTFFVQQPQYKSTATLLLVGTGRTSNQESVVLNNYVQLFKSRRVLEPVISDQGYDRNYTTLAANTGAENVKNTDIINVSITTTNAKTSKALLESAIQTFRAEAKTLYGDGSIKINVVDAADAPDMPTNIKPVQQIGLATVAAFALVVVALFFIYDYAAAQKTIARDKSTATRQPTSRPTNAKKPNTKAKKATPKK